MKSPKGIASPQKSMAKSVSFPFPPPKKKQKKSPAFAFSFVSNAEFLFPIDLWKIRWATKKKTYYFPLYWLVYGDPYNGLL